MQASNRSRRIRLVSFADGTFAGRRTQFEKEAEALSVFDDMFIYDSGTLPASFRAKHLDFMQSQPRGFGYWIWKPLIIHETLVMSSTDDVVVYLDIGFTLNAAGRDRFMDYVEIATESRHKMLSFQNVHTEYKWTKMDLAKRLRIEKSFPVMHTSQLTSGFIVLGKTASNIELLQEWQQVAVESDYRYSDDSRSTVENHPEFIEHRHDQSISSLLRKIRGTETTYYEVQAYSNYFARNKNKLPAWATRLRA